jgi:hypothetical protein
MRLSKRTCLIANGWPPRAGAFGAGVADRAVRQITETGQRTRRALRFATALRALDATLQRVAHRHACARAKVVLSPWSFDSAARYRSEKELAATAATVAKVVARARREGARHGACDASTIRYRELYGFTHGDPKYVYRAELGRGVELFVVGLPPEKRLPLRAYHSAMIYKNGVPIGYFEGLSLFERMESGFNLYYTFRDGETAWLYARTLNVMHHFTGVTAFSLDPYQIGHENEEGIESGAFWFYRKLGFRPTRKDTLQLTMKGRREDQNAQGISHPCATLRKLAQSPMIFELDAERVGDWDRFQIRKIGFKAQRGLNDEEKQALAQIFKAKAVVKK